MLFLQEYLSPAFRIYFFLVGIEFEEAWRQHSVIIKSTDAGVGQSELNPGSAVY